MRKKKKKNANEAEERKSGRSTRIVSQRTKQRTHRGIQEQIIRDDDEGRGSTSERRSLTIRKYLGSELDEWAKKRSRNIDGDRRAKRRRCTAVESRHCLRTTRIPKHAGRDTAMGRGVSFDFLRRSKDPTRLTKTGLGSRYAYIIPISPPQVK